FHAVCDDSSIDYKGNSVVSVFYKGRLISLKNITIRGFKTADNDLYIVGGDNSVGKVMVDGVTLIDSGKKGVAFGSGMYESVV
ncbi:peptidase G2, partial [Bacillus sp. SIMBA_033]